MTRPLCRSVGLLALAFLPLSGCVDTPGVIPYVDVQVDLNLSLPAYNNLNFPNNWLYISGGSRGLIVYRYTLDEFVVLDRHATWDVGAGCQCTVSPDGYTIEDRAAGRSGTSSTDPSSRARPPLRSNGTPPPGFRRCCPSERRIRPHLRARKSPGLSRGFSIRIGQADQ